MTALRRYQPLRASGGTVIPAEVRVAVQQRDRGCVGFTLDHWPAGVSLHPAGPELHHVRASHGMGMKSETSERNLVQLCNPCHRWATEHGKEARPLLLAYLSRFIEPVTA